MTISYLLSQARKTAASMRKQTVDAQKDLDDRKTEFQDCVQQARDLEDDILVSGARMNSSNTIFCLTGTYSMALL